MLNWQVGWWMDVFVRRLEHTKMLKLYSSITVVAFKTKFEENLMSVFFSFFFSFFLFLTLFLVVFFYLSIAPKPAYLAANGNTSTPVKEQY